MSSVPIQIPLESTLFDGLCSRFLSEFASPPLLASWAPGRVNLIGEHTDYNGGYVLPAAIPLGTLLLATPRVDNLLRVHSENLNAFAEIDLTFPSRVKEDSWLDYMAGIALEVQALGFETPGADVLVFSNVPLGSGLSSSAAFEMATLALFEGLGKFQLSVSDAALLGQRVENRYLGLSSGVMDQFAVRGAQSGMALFLDCRSLDYQLLPVSFPDCVLVVADTASPRRLTGSEYNQRVAECATAVNALEQATGKPGTQLRDFTLSDLLACEDRLPDTPFRRARHVITENSRTLSACVALQRGESEEFGRLMNASHYSLRDDFEVSSSELESLTGALRTQSGCLGARLTGAGFGGCVVALFRNSTIDVQLQLAMKDYQQATGRTPQAFKFHPASGAAFSFLCS